jgi:hypothetical protein
VGDRASRFDSEAFPSSLRLANARSLGRRIVLGSVDQITINPGYPRCSSPQAFVEGENVAIVYRWAEVNSIGCRHW